ncbi:2-amino-4-hydroxy-6-hydroxymethyldihydropteridine diphosphokinase, partial [Kitasatospora sp. NPDC094028]
MPETRGGRGGRGVRPQAGRPDHRPLRRRDRHHHPEPSMTRPFVQGHSDPTVQPVPASVVERVDAADTTLQNPKWAVISIGSNLGNRLETLQGAVDALEDTPGVRVKAVS